MLSVPLGLWQTLTCQVRVTGLVGGEGAGPEQSWVGPKRQQPGLAKVLPDR